MSDILTAASDTPVKWESNDTSFAAASDTPIKWDSADNATTSANEAPVKFTPDEIKSSDQEIKYGQMHQQGVQPFKTDNPTEDDIGYGRWLEKKGHLSSSNAPGFWSSLGHMVYETAAGVPEVFSQAYKYRMAKDFGTDKEAADAEKRSDALAASYANSLSTMYQSMGIGAARLTDKSHTAILNVAAEFEGDPAFKKRIQASDDASWYKYMRRMTVLGDDNKLVQDAATQMAVDAGWNKQGLENATATATFAGDPMAMAMGPAMGLAGKGISAVAGKTASALGMAGAKTAALGAADALRAEIALSAKNISSLEQLLERIPYTAESVGAEAAQEVYEQTAKQIAAANAAQSAKTAALKALDAENLKILAENGRPSIAGRVAGATGVKVASAVEKAGTFLAEMNQGVVDKVLNAVEADSASSTVGNIAKRMAPTAIVGGVVGAATSDDTTSGFIKGAAMGAALPTTMSNAGRLGRILGENYLIGRTTTPYFAKMATDAEANGLEKWAFRKLNTFSPVFDFSKNLAEASAKGAAVGAGFGYVSSGGEGGDLASAAAGGVAGHFTPWAAISSVHGFWSPVRSAAEFNNMQASNLRLLQDRWKGSDNLDRLNQLNPSQQLSVASVVSANPDVTLRLTTTDKNVIAADQLARGQVPQDVSNVPGFHYKDPISGRSVIVLNPEHPDAIKPVLAHEFWHKAQSEGLSQSIVSELVGDSALGLPGMYTKMEDGAPVRRADGSFEVTKEFSDAKAEYLRRLSSKGVEHSITDAEFALEHAAEQGSDYVMGGRFDEAIRPTIGSMMLDLMPEAVRNAVGTAGGALAPDGSIRGTMNLGLKPSPAVQKLFDSYMKDWRVGRNKATAEEAGRGLEISREQILKNPDILHSFKASGGINVDSNGNIAGTRVNPETGKLEIVDAKKVFKTSAQMAKEQGEFTKMVMEAVRNAKDTGSDADAVKITTENGREVAYGKYLSPETLAWIENSGKFNPFQLEHIKNLNALTKSGTGDYVRFFYEPAIKGGKYESIKGHWREEVPYSWHISKAENILFRTVSYDKVAGNLEKLWSKDNERASGLWTSQVSMMSDAKKYLENLSQGKPGETELTVEKKKFINLALGINTSDRASSNPLYDADAHRRLTSFVTARRIGRTNRLTPPERGDKLPWSYEAYSRGRFNMTAGEPIERDVGSNLEFAKPPSDEEAINALSKDKKQYFGKARNLPEGTPVGLRIDIPAFENNGTYVVTVHKPASPSDVGERIGYDTVVRVSDPKFFVKEGDEISRKGAQAIKEGRTNKHPIATVEGNFSASREIPNDINDWTAVGFDPKDHSYFYDKTTDKPVVGGKQAISVGNSVFVKDPIYGNKSNFQYSAGSEHAGQLHSENIPKEKDVDEFVTLHGLNDAEAKSYRDVVQQVRESDSTALPIEPQYDKNGRPKFDVEDGETTLKVSQVRYDFVNSPEVQQLKDRQKKSPKTDFSWRDKGTDILAGRLIEEAETAKLEPTTQAGIGWYSKMRSFLQNRFGAGIETFSQLLGATSARTPVDENFKQALDGLKKLSRGDYDAILQRFDEHIQPIKEQLKEGKIDEDQARKEINAFVEMPTRSNGKKFNANSKKVLQALYGNWLEMTQGPKTPNFAGNLSGRTLKATIDVWAARTARRLMYENKTYNEETGRISTAANRWRILPGAETGVEFSRNIGLDIGGDFGFAQEAFQKAADKLKMNADDLQALLWFHEKHIWDEKGWTKAAGKAKSSFESEASKLDTSRFQIGATTFTNADEFSLPKFHQELQKTRDVIAENPGIIYARVSPSHGLYGGTIEPSFDAEFVVSKGSDISHIVQHVVKLGKESNQYDVFVSQVVEEDHPNARPGMEIGFKTSEDQKFVDSVVSAFNSGAIDGFTIARDRRGRAIGIRTQFIPELSARWSEDKAAALDPSGVFTAAKTWSEKAREAVKNLHPDISNRLSYEQETHFDTRVFGREEYDTAPNTWSVSSLGVELGRRKQALGLVP